MTRIMLSSMDLVIRVDADEAGGSVNESRTSQADMTVDVSVQAALGKNEGMSQLAMWAPLYLA
ncbi:hypothetical protein ANO11243_048920 [Dothideomycetidae sp. 11243]|nr:hypothetical protein ANO11243_048920 [fungal sp. No.11243]